jgi:hypothetical protein
MASKDILKQAYASATPDQAKDPQAQQNIYNQAAMMAGQRGQASLAYSFQKQAKELEGAAQTKQLNDLKIKEDEISYAGQLLSGATTEEDLKSVIGQTVKDPAARMVVESVMRNPNLDFEAKKKSLSDMTMTAKEKLQKQRDDLLILKQIDSINKFDINQERLTNNATKANALAQIKVLQDRQIPITSELFSAAGFSPQQIKLLGGGDVSTSEKPTTTTTRKPIDESNLSTIKNYRGEAVKITPDMKPLADSGIQFFSAYRNQKDQDNIPRKEGNPNITPWETPVSKQVGKHSTGEAIDINTKALTADQKKVLADNGWVQPAWATDPKSGQYDPNHWEKKTAEASTEKQPSGTVTLPPKQSNAAAPKERAQNVLVGVGEAVNRFQAISSLPSNTTLGAFSGLTGKDSKGFTEGLKGIISRNWTTDDQRSFEKITAGLDIAMASAVGGGFASATSASKIAAYGKQLSRIGETSEQSIESLALIKQELETVINNYDKNPFASKEQKEGMKKELEKLNKAIPFNMDQINAVRKAKSSGKSFGEATVKGQPSKIMQDADAILGIK